MNLYDRIINKAQEIMSLPQVCHGAKFYVWDSPSLKVFLVAGDSLRVFAMAKPKKWFEVVADHHLFVWGDDEPHFTQAKYDVFKRQIFAALAASRNRR